MAVRPEIFADFAKNLPTKILDIISDLRYFTWFSRPYVVGVVKYGSLFGEFLWLKSLLVNLLTQGCTSGTV